MVRFPRWKRIIIGCAAVSAVLGLILLEENARGVIQLRRYRNRLVAAGEKLTPRELAPTIPAEQEANAAALDGAGETLGRLLKECPLIESFPALLEFTGSALAARLAAADRSGPRTRGRPELGRFPHANPAARETAVRT
jgi:hypothetical protein